MNDARRAESRVYVGLAVTQLTVYLLAPGLLPRWIPSARHFFGINQYKHFTLVSGVVVAILASAAVIAVRRYGTRVDSATERAGRWLSDDFRRLVPAGAIFALIAFAFRSHFLNQDSRDFVWKFARDVPLKGAHVTHDEMWELFVHSRFWDHTHRLFGWDVILSYQVLSCLAGGVFLVLLLLYARTVLPRQIPWLTLVVCSGGFMQLFFGDPENYTLTAAWVMGYLYAAALHLRGRCSVVWPSALLAVAMTFHVLAGWLGPSLAYLHVRQLRRGRVRESLIGSVAFAVILGGTLLFFHFNGLPIRRLFFDSHVFGHGGDILAMLAEPRGRYYLGIANLLLLLVPAVTLLPPLLIRRRIPLEPLNIHLALASVFLLIYMFTWKATLGVLSDWNLFAVIGIPLSLLIGVNLLQVDALRKNKALILALCWILGAHSYAWIVSNH